MIKCTSCSTQNIEEAEFCRKCGKKFTKQEKEKKQKGLIVSILTFIDNVMDKITLDFIKESKIFRILILIVIIGFGIFNTARNGLNMKIQKSENYKVQYNNEQKEYYLISPAEQISLNLYVPSRSKKTTLKLYDENNEIINEVNIEKEKPVVVEDTEKENYYVLEAEYGNNNMDRIKFFVYQEEN